MTQLRWPQKGGPRILESGTWARILDKKGGGVN